MLQLTSSTIPDSAASGDTTRALITERIRGEFREMPGLTLTLAQAQRLWNVDLGTCAEVLAQLVDVGYLCQRSDGAYGRASDLTARSSLRMARASLQFIEVDKPRR